MSAEPFDSGSVFSRARPVLTFATEVPVQRTRSPRGPDLTPTPSPISLHAARARELPVIPRIVRRPSALDAASPLIALLVRGQDVVRRSGAGTMMVAGLVLATTATIAGLGMRSLADQSSSVTSSAGVVAFDARGTEGLLARGPLAPRAEHVTVTPGADVQARGPVLPTRASITPSHPPPRPTAHASLAPLVKPGTPSRATAVYARR